MNRLTCPCCGNSIELSWSRYWFTPSGYHQCPGCNEKLKFQVNREYIQYSSWAVQMFLLAFCFTVLFAFGPGAPVLVVLPIVFSSRLARSIDSKYGMLVKH
jgi:hypothetical protein